MLTNVFKKVARLISTVVTIIISRNAENMILQNVSNYSFPKMLVIIMLQTVSTCNVQCSSPPKPPWYRYKSSPHGKRQHGGNSLGNRAHYFPQYFPQYFPHCFRSPNHQTPFEKKWNPCFFYEEIVRVIGCEIVWTICRTISATISAPSPIQFLRIQPGLVSNNTF